MPKYWCVGACEYNCMLFIDRPVVDYFVGDIILTFSRKEKKKILINLWQKWENVYYKKCVQLDNLKCKLSGSIS